MELTIQPGERWDQVSLRAYGSPMYAWEIISANIHLVKGMISSGDIVTQAIEIEIPELPVDSVSSAELPPWRR